MSDTTVAVTITADASGASQSVKNFKKELVLAQQEVVNLTAKFGATSKEAINAAKKAAELKDSIGDAKSLVDAFNPDTKFKAFGASINTLVGGFSALQGVMGLVGVESEETQKALLKVQSALAISQGVAQLQEGVQTFKNLGAVIKSTTIFQKANAVATNLAAGAMRLFGVQTAVASTGMKVLKTAIAATGIGLLVVGLAAAADALGLFADKSDEAAESQERLEQQLKLTNAALEAESNFLTREERLEVARARNKGASEEEIFQIQQKYRELNFNSIKRAYDEINDKNSEQAVKLLQQLKDLNTTAQTAQLDFDTKLNEERLKKAQEFSEKLKKQNELQRQKDLKEAQDELNRKAAGFAATGGPGGGLNISIPKTTEQLQIEQEAAARREARLEEQRLQEYAAQSYAQFTEIHNRNVQERIAQRELEFQNQQQLANASANILMSLSNLIGQQTAAGKVFAIASATIDTYAAAAAILKNSAKTPAGGLPGYAIAQMAAVIVAGLINVKKIASVKVPGGGGGGSSVPTPTNAPLAVQRPQQQTTALDQDSLNAIGNATTRAFVLESDISSSQEKITRLNRQARLGGMIIYAIALISF